MIRHNPSCGHVEFTLSPPRDVTHVAVAGSFNGWVPVPLHRKPDGRFRLALSIPAGTHEYKFVIDGEWLADPDNPLQVPNSYGTKNSFLHVIPRPNAIELDVGTAETSFASDEKPTLVPFWSHAPAEI